MSVITESTYPSTWPEESCPSLLPSDAKLCTYSGEGMEVLGCTKVSVCCKEQDKQLQLLVIHGSSPSLLGRDWWEELKLDCQELHHMHTLHNSALQSVLNKHHVPFQR